MHKCEIVKIVGSILLFCTLLYLGIIFTSQRLEVLISLSFGVTIFVLVYLSCYLGH